MKNKSKREIMETSKTDRLNSAYRGMVVRRMVDSEEQVGSLLIGCIGKTL